jgi:hypothetical protein
MTARPDPPTQNLTQNSGFADPSHLAEQVTTVPTDNLGPMVGHLL